MRSQLHIMDMKTRVLRADKHRKVTEQCIYILSEHIFKKHKAFNASLMPLDRAETNKEYMEQSA